MSGQVYLMIFGRSVWGSLNTFYAVLESTDYRPDSVVVFTEETYQNDLKNLEQGVREIASAYSLFPHIQKEVFPTGDFNRVGKYTRDLVRGLKAEGLEVAVDITSGRKVVVAAVICALARQRIEHLFYLGLDFLQDVAKPYMMIPLHLQHLHDFIEESPRHPP
ncbi:MAG: TM1812 family CRISPR-associated protein [Candidatus Ranarchaeia archaeon]